MTLQERIDGAAYPPTHQYRLADLAPTGILADRWEILQRTCPDFTMPYRWDGRRNSFLDVGCNKGFFSFRAVDCGLRPVTGIDPSLCGHGGEDFIGLCRDIRDGVLPEGRREHVTFQRQSFRDFIPPRRYSRVLLGNVHHYIYRECSGTFDWTAKLATLTEPEGLVAIEGPRGMACPDMGCIPPDMRAGFTQGRLERAMGRYFDLVTDVPATKYTPGRSLTIWRRHTDAGRCYAVEENAPGRILRSEARGKCSVYQTAGGLVFKVYPKPLGLREQLRVELASHSPASNGLEGYVTRGGDVVGWAEVFFPEIPVGLAQYERECSQGHFRQQLFYLRNGYLDEDPGTINWIIRPHGLVHFDKNSVMPVKRMSVEAIRRHLICWQQSYERMNLAVLKRIAEALWTRDGVRLERLYTELLCES